MDNRTKYLGIDIGSVSIGVAVMDDKNRVNQMSYGFHKGQIIKSLQQVISKIELNKIKSIGYTSTTPAILRQGKKIDTRIAYITAAKHFYPDLKSLLIIGAEKFGLATFDENGDYLSYHSNSSCAAGTGNFLDQQAERLNLKNIQEFCEIALSNTGSFPKIASRCAVFAKTDLIHAQQEGYSLSEICDGLSWGVARNIVDTVIRNPLFTSVVAAGGVSLNKSVLGHIEKLTDITIISDKYAHVYGAIGAALGAKNEENTLSTNLCRVSDLISKGKNEKKNYYPPLTLELSEYPDFESIRKYKFRSNRYPYMTQVEVDIFSNLPQKRSTEVFLGIDIGSTSTKAVLINRNKEVIAGLYTRTNGQPMHAVQVLLEAIVNIEKEGNFKHVIIGNGTTGSGRKFIGKIIGADVILDEISAHARAAFELDPETDTIIEIGGQDSKFTKIRNGLVTFSAMNNVCAAGTGSFIEEQAKRLDCPLDDYAKRAEKTGAPLANDRCTVFMERDLNQYLNDGYSASEMLATVLHCTRENYLSKVALRGGMGKKIFFQGATAKNRALVAAFEQKLKKPIMVSRFCHLTGALGVALELSDKGFNESKFRGLDLYKIKIPVRSEVCEICTNHCKLKVAEINNEIEAYGFLCGRDYDVKKFIKNQSIDFDLIRKRKERFNARPRSYKNAISIGIPAGLHLYDEIPFWREFFGLLGINSVSSENCTTVIKAGKNLCGAEFCAPIAALHGHVDYLRDKADYIFLPVYLQEFSDEKRNKQYCYYTQFVSSLISIEKRFEPRNKILTPMLKSTHGELFAQFELYKMLIKIGLKIDFLQVTQAYDQAKKYHQKLKENWIKLYENNVNRPDDFHIMLLGRPYTVLSSAMNNHIPELIEKNGVKTFYMDMMSFDKRKISFSEELTNTVKWKFASSVLQAAEIIAEKPGCYPVLITSFKCTPDSFVTEFFKDILNSHNKPYLILQLDEHDSTAGYETRIEAGIRAFRNHFDLQQKTNRDKPGGDSKKILIQAGNDKNLKKSILESQINSLINEASEILKAHSIDFNYFNKRIQELEIPENQFAGSIISNARILKNKTLLLPSWDTYVGPLIEAVLQHSGMDARLIYSSMESVQRSLSHNTGQCLPLNIIVQDAIDYIESNELDPSRIVLWLPKSSLSCNLSMFPYYARKLLKNYGNGMEFASVYRGDLIFYDVSLQTAINAYIAYMFGGYIRKIGCKIRPYERIEGSTNAIIEKSLWWLYETFKYGKDKETVISKIITAFESIEMDKDVRPKVAIFGDLYVRDNDLMNQDIIKTIEQNGGEVITTPYSEYIKIIVNSITERSFMEGNFLKYIKIRFLKSLIPLVEDKFRKYFCRMLEESPKENSIDFNNWLNQFNLNLLHRGESFENILKIYSLMRRNPDLRMFVQTNPSYCCPSLVTEAMASRIEELTGIPVVTIEYDGTAGLKNEKVIPYLKYNKSKNPELYN